eukprot:202872_1
MPYSSSYQTDIDLENERHKQAVIHLKRIYRDYQRYLDRSFELLMANLNHKHETEKQNLFTIYINVIHNTSTLHAPPHNTPSGALNISIKTSSFSSNSRATPFA